MGFTGRKLLTSEGSINTTMKTKFFFAILCTALMLTGCSSVFSSVEAEPDHSWEETGSITIGKFLTVQNNDSRLSLLNNIDALSADGLYYTAWTIGNAESYENSDGDTVDLYDAQLYLLLGEAKSGEEAKSNMNSWLNTGKTNYDVVSEEEITCGNQSYTLITYNCVSEDNPYARGVSAFGVHDHIAVCIELTCRESFEEELRPILIDFLNSCTFIAD